MACYYWLGNPQMKLIRRHELLSKENQKKKKKLFQVMLIKFQAWQIKLCSDILNETPWLHNYYIVHV